MKDVAIRVALGIPRKRLVLQMLWESIGMCCLGNMLAFFLANWATHTTTRAFDQIFALDEERPFWWQLRLDSDAILVLLVSVDSVNTLFLWRGFSARCKRHLCCVGQQYYTATSGNRHPTSPGLSRSPSDHTIFQEAGVQLALGLSIGLSLSLWAVNQLAQSLIISSHSLWVGLFGIPIFIVGLVLVVR